MSKNQALEQLNQQIDDLNITNAEHAEIVDEYVQSNELPESEPVYDGNSVRVYKSGLFALVKSKDEQDQGDYKHIGNYIMPVGKTSFNGVSCLLLEFVNMSGVLSDVMIERGELADCRGLARKLLNAGYNIDIYYSKNLQRFLNQYQPESEIIAVTQIGWIDDSYVLPHQVIGNNNNIRYYGSALDGKYRQSGTLDEWRTNVANHCIGYEMLELGLYAGFASLLMPHVDFGFGLHFHGDSSIGKSTILRVASSIFGKPKEYINKWNATHNGMEFIGYNANHSLCALDEVNEAAKSTLDSIYMLIDGRGKSRAISRTGGVEQAKPKTWQTVVLSTGEVSIEDLAIEYGKNLKAGESVRMIDLDVKSICKDKEHADTLIENSLQYYGSANIAFIEYVQRSSKNINITALYKKYYHELISQHSNLHSQANRVAKYFALMRLAGDLAVQAGILSSDFKTKYYTDNIFANWYKLHSLAKEQSDVIGELITAIDDYPNYFSNNDVDCIERIQKRIGIYDGMGFYLIPTLTSKVLYKSKRFDKQKNILVQANVISNYRKSMRDKTTKTPVKVYIINTDNLNQFREDNE